MKATGIVRKIDDLGRFVVPREIRRKMKLREGTPLEIFVSEDEIILKKFSTMASLNDIAAEYVSILSQQTGHIIMISDRDSVIAVSGVAKAGLLHAPISTDVIRLIDNRTPVLARKNESHFVNINSTEEGYESQIIVPIVQDGDVVGAIMLLTKNQRVIFGDLELKLALMTAKIIEKQLTI